MPHLHPVVDDDQRFVIDPTTRNVTNKAGSRTTIIQFDHNSEELVFEFPKIIEGHDMTLCDVIQVHFSNIGTGTSVSTRAVNDGVYEMTDLAESPEDSNILTCSWLVSQAATQNYGTIEFSLKFICYDNEDTGTPGYIWNTDICTSIDVKRSINNSDDILENYPDLYYQLEKRVSDLEKTGVSEADIRAAIEAYMAENPPVAIDTTLTISGAAADAKTVGDKLGTIASILDSINGEVV